MATVCDKSLGFSNNMKEKFWFEKKQGYLCINQAKQNIL